MTFALAMATPRIAFVAADRLYSGAPGLKGFLGTKLCRIETTDAQGILTYAGAGARSGGQPFEVSEWIERVLRGAKRDLDQSLQVLAAAALEQGFEKYDAGHTFAFAGYVSGKTWLSCVTSADQVFAIEKSGQRGLISAKDERGFRVLHFDVSQSKQTLGIVIGTGATHFNPMAIRDLGRRAAKARSNKQAATRLGAGISKINIEISAKVPETVGPEVACAWVFAKVGGGAHSFYDASGKRVRERGSLPGVALGIPASELRRVIVPEMIKHTHELLKAAQQGLPPPEVDEEKMKKLARQIDDKPKRKF